MKSLKKLKTIFVDYFGIGYRGIDRPEALSEIINYPEQSDDNILAEHRDYLLRLEDGEEKRLEGIESKTTQLIAQSGIVFSLLSIFIPILVEKSADIFFIYRIAIFVLLLFSISFYVLSIINAAKNYLVNRYQYAAPTPETVIEFGASSKEAFLNEQIKDLIKTIKVGKHQNNRKASNLIHSSRSFQAANIFSAVLVVVFALVLFNRKSQVEPTVIKNPLKIEGMDSLIKMIKDHDQKHIVVRKGDTIHTKAKIETKIVHPLIPKPIVKTDTLKKQL
jgi:hypothetical protein